MNRQEFFEALRPAFPNRSFSGDAIAVIDRVADKLGMARIGSAAEPSLAARLIDVAVLRAACPERSDAELTPWIAPIQAACAAHDINNIRRVAAFLAQMAHEGQFVAGRTENLNYRAERLMQVWPSRFASLAAATPYAGNPEKLANKVYANRLGNGDEASGDGWRFRGTGPGQLTGRDNWTRFGKSVGMTAEQAVEWGRTIEGGVMSFAWFWETNDVNRLADTLGVADEARKINGGDIGLADRTARFDRTVQALLAREKVA